MKYLSSKKIDALLALLSSTCFMILVYLRAGLAYELNDDVCINQILSGTITGEPDAHAIYVNYGLSKVLSWLYSITVNVPWYGIFLVSLLGISYSLIIYSFLSRCNTILAKLETMALLFGGIFLTAIYSSSQIQYTAVAAWAAIAGFCFLCLHYKSKRAYILFFVFELLAFLLRRDAMLMMQPVGFSVFGSLVLFDRELEKKQKLVEYAKTISAVLLCFLLGFLFNIIGYHSEEWDEYFAYNDARTTIYDYYEVPEYEEVADILDKYALTEKDYVGFSNYLNVGSRFPSECAKEIADYVVMNSPKEDFSQKLLRVAEDLIPKDDLINTVGIYAVLAIVLIAILLARRYYLFLPFLAIIGSHVVVWGYLAYRGRMLARVLYPLISGELVFLLVVYMIAKSNRETVANKCKTGYRVLIHIAFSVILCYLFFTSYDVGRLQYKSAIKKCRDTAFFQEGYAEIMNYCRTRSENTYALDLRSFLYCNTSVFDTTCYGPANSLLTGGWFGYSPNFTKRADEYLGDFSQKFYLIKYDGAADEDADIWTISPAYFQTVSKRTPRLVDTIAVQSGAVYNVYEY